jgi:hypothetical protein
VWMQNIAHWKPGGCNSRLFFLYVSSKHTYSLWGSQEHQSYQCIDFILIKKLMYFDLRSIE